MLKSKETFQLVLRQVAIISVPPFVLRRCHRKESSLYF